MLSTPLKNYARQIGSFYPRFRVNILIKKKGLKLELETNTNPPPGHLEKTVGIWEWSYLRFPIKNPTRQAKPCHNRSSNLPRHAAMELEVPCSCNGGTQQPWGFPTLTWSLKGVWNGETHHLRKHPNTLTWSMKMMWYCSTDHHILYLQSKIKSTDL